jgi:hypothetical protein
MAALAAGCGESPAAPEFHVYSRLETGAFESARSPLSVTLEAPSTAAAGGSISMRLVVRNTGAQPIDLEEAGYTPVDFVVTDENFVVVWEHRYGLNILDAARLRTLAPGEEVVFSQTWNQRDIRGQGVSRGNYLVRGIYHGNLSHEEASVWTEPVPLTIR